MKIYCGNNKYELTINKRLGTPYECLKKGVGLGLYSNLINYNPNYAPIVKNDIYCGNDILPKEKVLGTSPQCFRKGIGIGKYIQYKNQSPQKNTDLISQQYNNIELIFYLIILGTALAISIILKKMWIILLVCFSVCIYMIFF